MAEKQTTPVFVEGKEYVLEDMNDEAREAFDHVAELERKIANGMRNVKQMQGGHEFWMNRLKDNLEAKEAAE